MPSPAILVNEVTKGMLPSSVSLPSIVSSSIPVANFIYGCWRGYRWQARLNQNNAFAILADKGIQLLIGENKVALLGAQLLLILRCLNECVSGYIRLYHKYKKLTNAVRCYYPCLEEKPWIKERTFLWISPSSLHGMKVSLESTASYLDHVVYRIYKFGLALFILSMLTWEAVDSFSLTPSKRHEAMGEVVSNGLQFINQFADNTVLLTEELKKNEPSIQKILTHLGSKTTAADLISNIESMAKKTDDFRQGVNNMNAPLAEMVMTTSKKFVFSIAQMTALTDFLPTCLVPKPELSNQKTSSQSQPEIYGRYIPKEWITCPDKLSNLTTEKVNQIGTQTESTQCRVSKKVSTFRVPNPR